MSLDFKSDNVHPFELFSELLNEASRKGIPEHHAMTIATVNKDHQPSNRIVYFKGIIRGGFSFYTNYQGRKGLDLENNKNICANFFWPHLDQQVRISGYVEKLTDEESDKYFASRARNSQIGAWASLQSQTLNDYSDFERRFNDYEAKYKNQKVQRPPHWGGYIIVPLEIEFWFGRTARLHERYIFNRIDVQSSWQRFMRYP